MHENLVGRPRVRYATFLALTLTAVLVGAWKYDPSDYRKGDIAHHWPQHGAWRVALLVTDDAGDGVCTLGTSAGAQEETFFLIFYDDGDTLSVAWGDTNFTATNNENFDRREQLHEMSPNEMSQRGPDPLGPTDAVTLSVGDWTFFQLRPIRIVRLVGGLRFAMVASVFVAWQTPRRDSQSPFRNDGPDAVSSDQTLDRIALARALDFQDGTYFRLVSLKGFADAVKDLRDCVASLGAF